MNFRRTTMVRSRPVFMKMNPFCILYPFSAVSFTEFLQIRHRYLFCNCLNNLVVQTNPLKFTLLWGGGGNPHTVGFMDPKRKKGILLEKMPLSPYSQLLRKL